MLISLLLSAALGAQQQTRPVVAPPRKRATVVRDSSAPDSSTDRNAGRRRPVTAELMASAFKDRATRDLFEKARRARLGQDSANPTYDATARQRLSVNLGIGSRGREHLFFRRESAARIRWQHDVGAIVEVTGARAGIPMAPKAEEIEAAINDIAYMSPIPYYPGMESLWIMDESSSKVEANDKEIVNPLTLGAEAYYTYAIADSVTFTLPTKEQIRLREIEVRPREPERNLAVGSFWFDDNGRLVKSAYRLAVPLDVWQMVEEDGDSTDQVPGLVKGFI